MGGRRFALLVVAIYAAVFLFAVLCGGALGFLLALAS